MPHAPITPFFLIAESYTTKNSFMALTLYSEKVQMMILFGEDSPHFPKKFTNL